MIAYFLAAYLILNGIVFLVYGVDKYKAVHNKWRIPETTLLLKLILLYYMLLLFSRYRLQFLFFIRI